MTLRGADGRTGGTRASDAAVMLGCVALLALLLGVATVSLFASLAAIAVAGLLVVITILGLEKTGTALLLLAMLFAPMNSIGPSSAASFVTFADLFFFLGFVLLLPTILVRKVSPPVFFLGGAAIIFAVGLLSSSVANSPPASFALMARLVVSAIALPLAFMFWRPSWRLTGYLAGAYVIGGAISIGDALVFGSASYEGRYLGLTEHPNELGLTGLLAAALVPYIVKVMPPSHQWFWWAAGAANVAAIWYSGSRAALVVIIGLVLIYPAIERSLKAAGWLAAAGIVGIASLGQLVAETNSGDNPLGRLVGGGSATQSDEARRDLITDALKSIKGHPLLGTGFEDALVAHVTYLEVAVCVGVIGLIGWLMILWSGTRPLFTGPRPFHRLAYPMLAYVTVGPLTPSLWDRYLWAPLALSFLVAVPGRPDDPLRPDGPDDASTTTDETLSSSPPKEEAHS